MGISAGLDWLFGTAAAAAPEAAAAAETATALSPELIAAGSAAVDPAILAAAETGSLYAAPAAADLAATGAAAADLAATGASTAAPVATESFLPSLTGTSADYLASASGAGALTPTAETAALAPTSTALTAGAPGGAALGGLGTGAGAALPAGVAAPAADITVSAAPELTGTASQFAAAAPAATSVAVPEAANTVADIATTGASPLTQVANLAPQTLNDASPAAAQTFGVPQSSASSLGGQAVTQVADATQTAPAATAAAPAATTAAPAATDATTAAAPAATTTTTTAAPAADTAATTTASPLTDAQAVEQSLAQGGRKVAGEVAANAAAGSGFLGGVGDYIAKNPSLLLAGAGLAYNMLKPTPTPEFQPQLESSAAQMTAQGQQLQNYLTSGTLPPGVQTSLNSAAAAAKATIRSQYASRGMSGSSAEAADLQNVDNTIVSQGVNIASQLYSTGVSEENMANQIYNNLMQTSLAQDQQLSNAIAGFTNSLAGGWARSATPQG